MADIKGVTFQEGFSTAVIAVEKFGKVQNLGHRMGLQCNFLGKGFELSHLLLKLNIVENDVGVSDQVLVQ